MEHEKNVTNILKNVANFLKVIYTMQYENKPQDMWSERKVCLKSKERFRHFFRQRVGTKVTGADK
ncbi:hypothetical protein B5F13_06900 [Drancourtella sp. An177]|nr:hypothetical protein B5F13_06900 [Drancourtella sp. An177]